MRECGVQSSICLLGPWAILTLDSISIHRNYLQIHPQPSAEALVRGLMWEQHLDWGHLEARFASPRLRSPPLFSLSNTRYVGG
jgi:hypothetical protein